MEKGNKKKSLLTYFIVNEHDADIAIQNIFSESFINFQLKIILKCELDSYPQYDYDPYKMSIDYKNN